eukprot:PhF_6_TR1534/c0_g1_i2/m.2805/K11153/RDH12; retinol dehydrogenase 12
MLFPLWSFPLFGLLGFCLNVIIWPIHRLFSDKNKNKLFKNKLAGKVAIVTGSNIGIGKETAHGLVLRGAKVVLACRDITKAKQAAQDMGASPDSCYIIKLDLNDLKSVETFVEEVTKQFPEGIDILVNNAGINTTGTTVQGIEALWGVNFVGPYYLTKLLQSALKKKNGIVVNLSSVMHRFSPLELGSMNAKTSYSESKLAFIAFTTVLRLKVFEVSL